MAAIALAIIPGFSLAATLHVGPGQTYTTITGAVNAASAGDTILVDGGEYHEAVTVNKQLTLRGNGTRPTITQWNTSTYYGMTINAPGVVVDGFKIIGRGSGSGCIQVNGVAYTHIENVDLSNGEYGVNAQASPSTTISSVTVSGCSYSSDTGGIFFQNSDKGTVVDSTVTGGKAGIRFWNSPHGIITNCTVSDVTENGIYLYPTSYNAVISDCTVMNTTSGITVVNTDGVTISNSYLNGNGKTYGIYIDTSVNDNIAGCTITNSNNNIYLTNVGYSHITGTTVKNAGSNDLTLMNCNNMDISGDSAFNTAKTYGIMAQGGSNIIVNRTTVSDNNIGIYLKGTTNSLIIRTEFLNNVGDGISNGFGLVLSGTTGISVYQNGFNGNAYPSKIRDVLSDQTTGTAWDTASPVTYTITNTDQTNSSIVYVNNYTNYTGNYWGAYHANDSNNDLIADRPWVESVPSSSYQTVIDYYPLLFDPATQNSSYSSVSWSGPAIPAVTPTATPIPSPFPSPSPLPSISPSASASPTHTCTPRPSNSNPATPVPTTAVTTAPDSGGSGGSSGSGGSGGSSGTSTVTPSASASPTGAPSSGSSVTPTACAETPTPTIGSTPTASEGTSGSTALYVLLAILAILAVVGIAAYFLTRKK